MSETTVEEITDPIQKTLSEEFDRFEPHSLDEDQRIAHHHIRKMVEFDAERERVKAQTIKILARIDSEQKAHEFMFGDRGEAAIRRMIARGKRKSIETPYGTAGYRRVGEKLVVLDEDTVKRQVLEGKLPGTILSVPKPDVLVSQIEKHFYESGVLPDGCNILPARESFYVR